MNADDYDDLLGRLNKMASVGATILSNATQAKRVLEREPVDRPPDPPEVAGYGTTAYGSGVYGA